MRAFIYFFISLFYGSLAYGQNSDLSNEIKSSIETRSFVFQVQSVSPRRGGMIQQSPGYKVSINKDTLTSLLPYIGRAYQAGYGSSDAGLNFTSMDYEYKVEDRKKGGWNITIKVKDAKSARQLMFDVFENGKAYLSVNCVDRESISYNGYLEPRKSN